MTLVVSKIINGKLHNISDSLVTDRANFTGTYQPNEDMFASILKTAIIHRRICISYAGVVENADNCLYEIIKKKSYTIKWVVECIKKYTLNPDNQTQFLVGYIDDDGAVHNWKIVNGELLDFSNSLSCIGDPKAIKVFEKKLDELISSGIEESLAMRNAFDFTIADDSIKSVGHFAIHVGSGKRSLRKGNSSHDEIVFNYLEMMISQLKHDMPLNFESEKTANLPVNPEEDLTGMSIFVTEDVNKFGIAVYSLFHKKGLLFCPKLDLKRIFFKTVKGETVESSYQNFIDDIYKKYKLPMRGLVWSDVWGFKPITNFDYNKQT